MLIYTFQLLGLALEKARQFHNMFRRQNMTARLRFWKDRDRRPAKGLWTERPPPDPATGTCDYMPGRSPSPIRRHSRGFRGSSFFRSWIASHANNHAKLQLTRKGPHARSDGPSKLAPIIVHDTNTKKETSDITSAANFHGPRPFHRATIVGRSDTRRQPNR